MGDSERPLEHSPVDTDLSKMATSPQVNFDWTEWLEFLDDVDGSDEEKRALIETLWAVVLGFVDLGWNVSAPKSESCGKTVNLNALIAAAVVNSDVGNQ